MKFRLCKLAAVLVMLVCAACGEPRPTSNPRFKPRNPADVDGKAPKLHQAAALPSVVIAELASEQSEVYFARNNTRGLLLTRKRGRWLTGPVFVDRGDEAVPDEQPRLREVAVAPDERTPFALRGVADGFVLAWVVPVQAGGEVWAMGLDAKGVGRGKAKKISRAYENVTWVDVMVHQSEATVLWEVRRGEKSDVFLAPWTKGKMTPIVAASDASGWHATASQAGIAVTWVSEAGRVTFVEVAKNGTRSTPLSLTQEASAVIDVQVAALNDLYIVAWTNRADSDPHVHLAEVSIGGTLSKAAAPATPPVGGQALVALLANEDHSRALLAWEADIGVGKAARPIRLDMRDRDGVSASATLEFHAPADVPQFVADGTGFTALTFAPARYRNMDASAEPPIAPVFVRLDRDLRVRAAEPIRIDELAERGVGVPGVPQSVHGLHCEKDLCSLIATSKGTPALLSLVTLPKRRSVWLAPSSRLKLSEPPLATALDTLADVDGSIADMSAVTLADGRQLVAWVTHFTGKGDGPAPPGATLAYRFIEGGKRGPIVVLSENAISIGGVKALALPEKKKRRANDPVALLAWAGPNSGSSQVYITKLSRKGKKLLQKTVTKVKRKNKSGALPNEVYDIDLVRTPKGNLVCTWADTRDGTPEIYAARLNANLVRKNQDRRITTSNGPSMEPAALVVGELIYITWSEAEADGKPADIRAAVFDGGLTPLPYKARISSTPSHSRSPKWVGTSKEALAISWIEDGDGARLVAVSGEAEALSDARKLSLTGGAAVTSTTIHCDATRCRGMLAAAYGGTLRLGAFDTQRSLGTPVQSVPLATLAGGAASDADLTSPVDLGSVVFLHGMSSGVRIRRLGLRW
jgi:hypothetical protein